MSEMRMNQISQFGFTNFLTVKLVIGISAVINSAFRTRKNQKPGRFQNAAEFREHFFVLLEVLEGLKARDHIHRAITNGYRYCVTDQKAQVGSAVFSARVLYSIGGNVNAVDKGSNCCQQ